MTQFPNASVISILTYSIDDREKLLFAYSKPIPDIAPPNTYWYPGRGKNKKAAILWQKFNLRQYFAVGLETKIEEVFEKLILTRQLSVDDNVIDISFPSEYLNKSEAYNPFYNRSIGTIDSYSCVSLDHPPELISVENLGLLEGFNVMPDQHVKPVSPAGFYDKGFLNKHLKDEVFALRERRGEYITIRGIKGKNLEDESCYGLKGFIQTRNLTPTISVFFQDSTGEKTGNGTVSNSGYFQFVTTSSSDRGTVQITNDNGATFRGIPFTLLKKVSFDVGFASKSYHDLYKRPFIVADNTADIPRSAITSTTIIREMFQSKEMADQHLSDTMFEMLTYLGSDVAVLDPYFLGPLPLNSNANEFELDFSQKAFVNAVIRSTLEKKLHSLDIIGSFASAKNLSPASTDDSKNATLMKSYNLLFDTLLVNFKNQKVTLSTVIKISRTKEFHNRYWIGYEDSDVGRRPRKCILVSNSIGNMDEVDFIHIENADQLNIIFAHLHSLTSIMKTELEIK